MIDRKLEKKETKRHNRQKCNKLFGISSEISARGVTHFSKIRRQFTKQPANARMPIVEI